MKKYFLLLFLLINCVAFSQQNSLMVEQLRIEYQTNPLGLGVAAPRFSWKLKSVSRNVMQTTYQIWVSTSEKMTKKNIVWDSEEVASDASHLIEYQGKTLQSRQRYFWKVLVKDNQGNETQSPTAFFEMGQLAASDWKAQWIEPEKEGFDVKKQQPVPLLRKEFVAKGKIASARLYVTSHGLHEIEINGKRVGDAVLAPGWTAYQSHLQYYTHDVTDHLKTGLNAIGAMLGDGWYRGFLAWEDNRNVYGQRLGLLAQLHIRYANGSEEIIGTNDTWKASNDGPIREADIYNGETYDARLEKNFSMAGFDAKNWWAVKVADFPKNNLVASASPPVRRIEEIKPRRIFKTPAGETVLDFGQNMVGWVRFKVQGAAGKTVRITHAEVLDQKGNFYTANLRHAKCELNYTLKGGGVETYEPRFTFMGFQFVRLENWPTEATLNDIVGVVIHSDMPISGSFKCSKPLINQLQHNIVWGQKGNFVDVPTDCPQRDERLGWTGDAQAFARTATFNKDVAGFFTKWLKDVAADQKPDGVVPFVVPDALRNNQASAGWSDVATIVPMEMYQVYGDKRLLSDQYGSMKKWTNYIRQQAGDANLWRSGSHFGDWLSYRGTNAQYGEPTTDNDFIATAFYAHSAKLTSQAALVLGKVMDAVEYGELHEKIKKAFNQEYVSPSGRLVCNTQTAYVLALHFDLLPENLRQQAVERLVTDIKNHDNHLTTGFLGTPYLCHVLTRFGKNDVAYTLLNQETYPSWLYPIKMGATTIWERWDGIKPDGSFQDVGMNSYNHYAYGAIGDWMYQNMTGIQLGETGFKKIVFAPKPGGGITSAKASYESPYGIIVSSWETNNGKTTVSVQVPPNSSAQMILPNATPEKTAELAKAQGLKSAQGKIEIGSGTYVFSY
ncbi:MAG: alpha-L-rhamnosidase [Runella slithyformis]|nr:MAG: alpha-L-rhamnosidase [Runella slithyformis]